MQINEQAKWKQKKNGNTDTTKKSNQPHLLNSIWANPNRWTEMEMGEDEKLAKIQSPCMTYNAILQRQKASTAFAYFYKYAYNKIETLWFQMIVGVWVYCSTHTHIHTMTNGNYITQLEI